MNEFERYKERLLNNKFTDWKERVAKILSQKSLSSVMNDTKWIELQIAVHTLPFLPPFILKCVTDESDYPDGQLSDAPNYIGDWSSYWEDGFVAGKYTPIHTEIDIFGSNNVVKLLTRI